MRRTICGARGYPGSDTPRMPCSQCKAKDVELVALKEALQEIIRISDRKHNAWDKAKQLLCGKTD